MKKQIRIIHIMSQTPPYHLYPNQSPPIHWENSNGETFGFWDYEWADQIFNNLIAHAKSNEFVFEVWQPDFIADKVYSHVFNNGLIHSLFPAKNIFTKLTLFGGKMELFCPLMFQELQSKINEGRVLIHSFFNSRYNIRILLSRFGKDIPFLFQFATNSEFHPYYGRLAPRNLKNNIQNFILNRFYRNIRYIFTSSNETIRKDIKGLELFKHEGISNIGIDFKKLETFVTKVEARNYLGIDYEQKVFFLSQRIVPEKQIDKLLIAVSKLKGDNYCFYISGTGDENYMNALKDMIRDLKVEKNVKLLNYIDDDLLRFYYRAADFFISTSISEAGPDSVYKAMYYGIPIITTNTGIGYEFLKACDSGLIIDRYNSALWEKVIQEVIDNKIQIRVVSKDLISDFFGWNKVSSYYYRVYEKIIFNTRI